MKSLAISILLVSTFQLGQKLISEIKNLTSLQLLEGISPANSYTLRTWVSFLDNSSNETPIFQVKDQSNSDLIVKVSRSVPYLFSVCSSSCINVLRSLVPYKWIYISASFTENEVSFCTSEWETKTIACNTAFLENSPFTEACVVSTTSQDNEIYDFHLDFDFMRPSKLEEVVGFYTCHSVCPSCYGPSPTACTEFLPVTRLSQLHTMNTSPSGLDFSSGSVPFRGRDYSTVSALGVTGWFKIPNVSSLGWVEVFRMWTEK